MRFGENNVLCPIYINIYKFQGVQGGGKQIPAYIFSLLLKKTEKLQEHDLYLNQILHHFDLTKKFVGWIIKILGKGGQRGALSY